MNIKSLVATAAIGLAAASSSFATVAGEPLGVLAPTASFSRTVGAGSFMDTYNFDLSVASIVAASATNVEITFGGFSFGGISNFAATLNNKPLLFNLFESTGDGVTISTSVVAGSTSLPAGNFKLTVSGIAAAGGASYGGNIVATPVPEPESYAMLLAGLGVMGAIAVRRNKRKQD